MLTVRPVLVRAAAETAVETPDRPQLPWAMTDVRRLLRTLGLGATGLVVAWTVASGTTQLSRQGYAIVAGILATGAAAAGCAGWLLAGTRAVRTERARLMTEVNALIARRSPQPLAAAATGLVTAKGMRHVHEASCPMARGKALQAASADHSLEACPICLRVER